MYSKIFMMFLLFDLCCCYHLFEFSKYHVNVQPNGAINHDILPIKFFKKTYNRHTNFALEKRKRIKVQHLVKHFHFRHSVIVIMNTIKILLYNVCKIDHQVGGVFIMHVLVLQSLNFIM